MAAWGFVLKKRRGRFRSRLAIYQFCRLATAAAAISTTTSAVTATAAISAAVTAATGSTTAAATVTTLRRTIHPAFRLGQQGPAAKGELAALGLLRARFRRSSSPTPETVNV